MVLTFFSRAGGGCATSNALAIAMQAAMEGYKTVLLDVTFDTYNTPQIAFLPQVENNQSGYFENVGIDALVRNVSAGTLKEENIRDIETEISENLYYIPRTLKKNYEIYVDELKKSVEAMIKSLNLYHDVVIIDVGYGMNQTKEEIIKYSDLLILNVPQNIGVLKRYVKQAYTRQDNVFYLVGNYDLSSKYSVKRLKGEISKQKKGQKIAMSYILHNAEFADSTQNTQLLSFFNRNEEVEKEDYNYPFMESVKKSFKKIRKEYEKRVEEE
ncbi:MAG: ParA family protein [Clostridiales bacterium]|nr:ParA family protein [Clostridiales bacterium]